jgi:DNA-binding beta-propeller fold protein YncE
MKTITRRPAGGVPPSARRPLTRRPLTRRPLTRRPLRWLSVAACVLVASGLLMTSADAGTGDLNYAGCIGDLAGCTTTTPAGALDGASAVAVTPSGTDLYAASDTGDDVSHFKIDSSGNLTFDGCIGDLAGCTPATANALDGADALAISGANLYVAADSGDNVTHFLIDSSGNLTFAGCIGDLTGCTPITARALDGASGLAVSPGGTDLYATSRLGNVVTHFQIDSSGNLIFAGCIGNLTGCTAIPANALAGARGVAVAPSGADLYAAASTGNVLDHFLIGTGGGLTFDGCIGDLTGCTPTVPRTALDGATGVAVNPAGTLLYATSVRGNVVSQLNIGAAGGLVFKGCIGNHRKCTPTTPKTALNGASGVAVTTSGPPEAYVTSAVGNVVSHFRINGFGNLIFAGCIGGLGGCTTITPHVLDGAAGLALTGNSAHLYAASFLGNAVSHFTIARSSATRRRAP